MADEAAGGRSRHLERKGHVLRSRSSGFSLEAQVRTSQSRARHEGCEPPHVGHGGWTWNTESAGGDVSGGIERLLGFHLQGTRLYLDPCIPRAWRSFEIAFGYHTSCYDIVVENPHGVAWGVSSVALDGAVPTGDGMPIPLADDNRMHQVRFVLASETPRAPGEHEEVVRNDTPR